MIKIVSDSQIPLLVGCIPAGGSGVCFIYTALGGVSVSIFLSNALGVGLIVPNGAIMVDHEDFSTKVTRGDGGAISGAYITL